MSKGQNEMAKRVLLSTLNVGDKFTSDIKGGNFIITSKVGDRINIQDLDTGKETFFGSGSYMVEPINEEAPQQSYTFRQPEYMDDPEYGEKSAEEIYTESKKARKSLKEEVIVIHHPWGEEIKDYKAGDPIPAGTKFKIFKTRDQKAIDAWIDSLYESVSSRNHKFKPEELKVGKRVIDKVGGKEIRGKITVNHNDLYKDNPYTQDKKGSTVVTIVTDSGRSYDVDANDNGGEFILEGCKGKKKISEGYTVIFPTGSSEKLKTIADVNKFVNGVLKMMGKKASNVQLTDATLDKWNKENDIPLVIVKESIESQVPLWTLKKGQKFRVPYDTNIHKAGEQLFKITYVSDHQVDAIDDKGVPYTWENPAQTMVIKESRIAKGYENLNADERAKHLLSHPSSKYMSDLKSENITERAIRKAVKEMLGKPDKCDPQFITDVNEGCGKVQESFLIKTKNGFYITKDNNHYDLTDDKSKAAKFGDQAGANREISFIRKYVPDSRFSKPNWLEAIQEEGEAPAIANTTTAVANPELPLKLKESVGQKLNITLVRKPLNMGEVESAIKYGYGERVRAVIDKSYTLSKSEYEAFVYNFFRHTTYLSGEGGHNSDGTVSVIEIKAPGMKTIYVDPEGYDYARYVGY